MAVKCISKKTSGLLKGLDKLYPVIKPAPKIDEEATAKYLVQNSHWSEASYKGTMAAVALTLSYFLSTGHPVEIAELGTFFLKMKGDIEKNSKGATTLVNAEVETITFRPNRKFLDRIKMETKFSLDHEEKENAQITKEQSLEIIHKLCDEKGEFYIDDFGNYAASLPGNKTVSRSFVNRILKGFVNDGTLTYRIIGRNHLYRLAEK
ncbi:MAG: hypothetical protein J5729_00160 [Bacteroidaceae bacterium]|nr:hypothetical protein [Bacteroidaceae bacterium]